VTGRRARVVTLRVTGVVLAVIGGVAALAGAALIAADLADRTDEWDGIWIFFGILVAVPGSLLVLAGVTVARTARRDTLTPAVVTGVVGVVTVVIAGNNGHSLGLGLTTPMLVSGLLLIVVAAVCGRARDPD
jgi:peptidoglycan/LPS O-acetylase OafA/YrhL